MHFVFLGASDSTANLYDWEEMDKPSRQNSTEDFLV